MRPSNPARTASAVPRGRSSSRFPSVEEVEKMAKALFGHVSARSDVRLIEEVGRLRRRVEELEQELAAARADNDRLAATLRVGDDDLLRLSDLEHAGI